MVMKKNELESYIFRLKELAADEFKKPYLKEEEIENFLNKSQEIDDFMFSDEIDIITYPDLSKKVHEVVKLIQPM